MLAVFRCKGASMISQALAARFLKQESGPSFPIYIVVCLARFCFKILDARIGGFPS